jgi:hypothetical protein
MIGDPEHASPDERIDPDRKGLGDAYSYTHQRKAIFGYSQ